MRFKHVFYLHPDMRPKLFEEAWRETEIDRLNTAYIPPHLQESYYIAEFFFSSKNTLLDAANAVENSSDLIVPNLDLLTENPDALSEALPVLRQKMAVIRIMDPYQVFDLGEKAIWNIVNVMLISQANAKTKALEEAAQSAPPREKKTKKDENNEDEDGNPKPRPRGFGERLYTDDQVRTMRYMRQSGSSIGQIAKSFHASTSTVFKFVHDVKKAAERVRKTEKPWSTDLHESIIEFAEENSELHYAIKAFLCTFTLAHTQDRQRKMIRSFFTHYMRHYEKKASSPREIKPEHITQFLWRKHKDTTTSVTSFNFYSLRRFFRYCVEHEFASEDIFAEMKPPASTRSRVVKSQDLTEEELAKILQYFTYRYRCSDLRRTPVHHFITLRNLTIVMIYATTGMRANEVRTLKLKNLAMENETVILTAIGKRGNQIVARLSQDVSALVLRYVSYYKAGLTRDNYLFTVGIGDQAVILPDSIRQFISDAARKVGILKPVSTHSFRTTFATLAIKKGMSLIELQRRLGHATPDQTLAYVRRFETLQPNAFIPEFVGNFCNEALEQKR